MDLLSYLKHPCRKASKYKLANFIGLVLLLAAFALSCTDRFCIGPKDTNATAAADSIHAAIYDSTLAAYDSTHTAEGFSSSVGGASLDLFEHLHRLHIIIEAPPQQLRAQQAAGVELDEVV